MSKYSAQKLTIIKCQLYDLCMVTTETGRSQLTFEIETDFITEFSHDHEEQRKLHQTIRYLGRSKKW